ncbi:MAG: right-handed parallel beta-helix repeat-containing protein, partial [Chloroflexi bacterium]|nr:right-handed parallel beta-helix repeat-containing protein [Chloroflexota bacterium]
MNTPKEARYTWNQNRTSLIVALSVTALLILLLFGSAMAVTAAPAVRPAGDTHIPAGTITADTTWTLANSPYIVDGNVTVAAGVTLTVEAGVTVKTDYYAEIKVQGRLVAIGTAEQPILFTSKVDTGPGQWKGLFFDGGTGDLRHVTVRYAGPTNSGSLSGNIVAQNVLAGEVRISDSIISGAQRIDYTDAGLLVQDSHVVVSNTLFTQNGGGGGNNDAPMKIAGPLSVVTMTANSFITNTINRVLIYPGAMMAADARLTPQTILEGYQLLDGLTVPPTVTLTVEPGVTILANGELQVQGHLNAIGTEAQPILFSSAYNTGPQQWKGLAFNGGTGDLRHVTVRYAGAANSLGSAANVAAHNVLAGEVRISDSVIRQEYRSDYTDAGLYVQDSHVAVSNTLFTQNGGGGGNNDAPMKIVGALSVVTMTANSFVNNVNDRVLLYPGAMMAADARLSPQTILQGYELLDDWIIPPTVTLTLEGGVTIMGRSLVELLVQGRLDALGTATQPVILTSVTNTGPGQWAGVVFQGGTGRLRHTTVRYAGQTDSLGSQASIYALGVLAGEVRLENSQVLDNSSYGLYAANSQVTLDGTTVTNNGSTGLQIAGSSTVLISGSTLESNSGGAAVVNGDDALLKVTNSLIVDNGTAPNQAGGVRNNGQATVVLGGDPDAGNAIQFNAGLGANQAGLSGHIVATYNWWGDASGPTHPSNPGGVGEEVSDRVIFTHWLTSTPSVPVSPQTFVRASAPASASPGEAVNLGVSFTNAATDTLRGVVVVSQLPQEAGYLYSTGGGQYWPE